MSPSNPLKMPHTKRLKKVEKRVENKGRDSLKLTRAEEEVASLLSTEFLTPKQIALRRQTSDKAVYKIIQNLKKKGAIDRGGKKVEKKPRVFSTIGRGGKERSNRLFAFMVRSLILKSFIKMRSMRV